MTTMSEYLHLLDTETGEEYMGDDVWEALNDELGTSATLVVMHRRNYDAVERVTGGRLKLSVCQEQSWTSPR